MDNENIALILKDAINASTAKIQNESKHTKVFVLPSELLKGLLGKNETPNSNAATKAEKSRSKSNKKTTTVRKQPSENSKSTALPVDRPKRSYNRQSSASMAAKNIKSQKSSKSNPKGLKGKNQNQEQNAASENNETSGTLPPVETITTQKKSSRGRKAKTKKENEPSTSCDVEKSPETILVRTQEKCTENNRELDDYSINESSDKPLDNSGIEIFTTMISDKIEEKCIINNHEVDNYSIDEVSTNMIQENNVTIAKSVASNFEEKPSDDSIKLPDIEIKAIDQVLQDPKIEISKNDASQKISNGQILSDIELNDKMLANISSPKANQLSNQEDIIIEEDAYILEEIIEIIESDEETVLGGNDEAGTLDPDNIKTDRVLPVVNTDFSNPISAPVIIKSEPVSETISVDAQPIVEQKRPNVRVYVNNRMNRRLGRVGIHLKSFPQMNNDAIRYRLIETSGVESQNLQQAHQKTDENNLTTLRTDIDYNENATSLPNISPIKIPMIHTFAKLSYSQDQEESDLEPNYDFGQDDIFSIPPILRKDLQKCSQKSQKKSDSDNKCQFDENSLTNIVQSETFTANQCQEISYSEVREQELPSLEIDCNVDENNSSRRAAPSPVKKATKNLRGEFKLTQKVQEKHSSDVECTSELNAVTDSAITESPCQKTKQSQDTQEPTNLEGRVDQVSLNTTETEAIKINSHEDLKNDQLASVLEMSVQKADSDDKILIPLEDLDENLQNHQENTEEIRKTKDSNDKSKNQKEYIEIKVTNIGTRRKSLNAKQDVESVSENAKLMNEQMETDLKSANNSVSGELKKYSANGNVNNVEQTAVALNSVETHNSCNNNELGESKDCWENEKNCSIISLRQLRNRTKVIPQDPKNFNQLKNHIEKESLYLRNCNKSDIIVRYDFDVSSRTRSVSLNLEPSTPEKLSRSPKKISRKSQSTDNYLHSTDRIVTLRKRGAIPENETVSFAVLEGSNTIQNKDGSSVETVKKNSNEFATLNVNHKVDEIMTLDSNLNKKLSSNAVDLQKLSFPTETASDKSSLSSKPEKVIVVKKIMKGRRSKSSQPKDELVVTTNLPKSDNKGSERDNDSKVADDTVNLGKNQHAKIETPTRNSIDTKLNISSIDSSDFQGKISAEEKSVKIESKKVTPVKKGRRGKLTKSASSKEVAVENTKKPDENMSLSGGNVDNIPEMQSIDPLNPASQVESALEESRAKIKVEKVPPFKRVGRGKTAKSSASNETLIENAKDDCEQDVINDSMTSSIQKADENMIASDDNFNKITGKKSADKSNTDMQVENAFKENNVKIKIKKVTPVRRGRRGKSSKSFTSDEIVAVNAKNDFDLNKNNHELESVNGFSVVEDADLDNARECSPVDPRTADVLTENVSKETSLKIKTEKVPPTKRGRKRRLSKASVSEDNTIVEKHKESDKIDNEFEVSKDDATEDNILANHSATSENQENAMVSRDLDDQSECDPPELSKADDKRENSLSRTRSKAKSQKLPSTKRGKRGRRRKSSQSQVSTKVNVEVNNDCTAPFVENSADSQDNNVSKLEELNANSHTGKSTNSDIEIDSAIGESISLFDSPDVLCNEDTTPVDDKIKEKPEKRTTRLPRQSSRHDKQDALTSNKDDVMKTKQHSRRSSKINVNSEIVDSNDDRKNTEGESTTMRGIRKSGRVQKSAVNYQVPDEDVDVFASEQRIEKGPKRRRGRPSKKDAIDASTEENLERSLQESAEKAKDLDATINDIDSPSTDVSNTLVRKRRAIKRSTIDENIFEVESKTTSQEKPSDASDDPQAEALSGAASVENFFEDSHFSDRQEEEEEEEPKLRRGRKRKRSTTSFVPGRKGRTPRKSRSKRNDEDYAPHHSYVTRPSQDKGKPKQVVNNKIVKCGKCGKEMPKNQWYSHNLCAHNDMGWPDGAKKPDFENDQKLLTRVLSAAHKKKLKRGLVCEACREIKRSVVGFISHITFCGKTEEEIESLMVICGQCGGKFKPCSMEYHERQHRLEGDVRKKKEKELQEMIINTCEPRSKRKAAEKAVSRISEFTALVKDEDGFSAAKKYKLSSPHIKKFIQKPLAKKRISSLVIAKWKKDLAKNRDAACSQLGCEFTCKSFDEIREHYASCNYTVTENYVCKICQYQTLFEDEIVRHAAEKHTSDDFDRNAALSDVEASASEDYSEVDEDNSNQSQSNKGLVKKFFYKETSDVENKLFKFIFNNGACHTILNKTFLSGYQWTLEFERKHFKFRLFRDLAPNDFMLLEGEDAESYLPELDLSMPVRFVKKDVPSNKPDWKNWSRFEASCVDDCPTFFVGGPVWAMAWAPTPSYLALSDDLPQFLAVSTHSTMDAEYSVGQSYSGKNIIQIWSVGKLTNRNGSVVDPKLSYSIAHNGGTVWSMEWCPSGCYQHEDFSDLKGENGSSRLGLLAAGCSDGCVRVYSLVFPEDLHYSSNENRHLVYKTEPVVQLIVDSEIHESKKSWQVMKICWSRESNHNVIVAGFSNGYVALWNLSHKSPFLRYTVNDTTFIRPYKLFFAHHHAVTVVALVPQDNKRYLATAGLDKLYKFWDLEDISKPKNTYKKSYVTDGAWMNNWCCAILAHDDALCMGNNPIVCLPLRNYTYKYYNLLPSNSTVYGISTSDYGNSLATGNVAGELLTLFPHQLIYIRDMEKTIPPKRNCSLVSTTELVDFKAEPEVDPSANNDQKGKKECYSSPSDFLPSTYKDSKDRFGIQFSTNTNFFPYQRLKNGNRKLTLTCEKMQQTAVEQYPLKSINKVAWNPNASSFLWLAAGYQNGFVRLISLGSAGSPAESNNLLQSHVNALKAQLVNATFENEC